MKAIFSRFPDFSVGDLRAHRWLCKTLATFSSSLLLATMSVPAYAGTPVLGGDATLTGATGASLAQNTDAYAQFASSGGASAVLDWSKFNIGAGKEMSFSGASTTFFNLVDASASKSQIDGIISGNGSVWVINPNGIAFGAASQVNVGGLFAAAAGNISNADDLRNGTATAPTFSSFAGSVDVQGGSKFTADQVALLGKAVSAAGDFAGVNALTIGASSGTMTVDDIGGGKVSVNIGDFVAADAEVSLGDLDVGGSLSVKSVGTISSAPAPTSSDSAGPKLLSATKTGSVIQAGDIELMAYDDLEVDGKLQSTAGHVSLLAYGDMDVNADVEAYDYASLQAMGDVNVNADVTVGGNATIYSYSGGVSVQNDSTVSAVGDIDIAAGLGDGVKVDVVVDGNVESFYGDVMLYSGYGNQSTGDVTLNGNVAATMGSIDAYAGFGYAMGTDGKLTVNGNLTAYSSVGLKTGNGDINVGEKAVVSASGMYGMVNVHTAADAGYGLMTGEGHSGNIEINGTLKADGAYGQVDVVAGMEAGAQGAVTLNGSVSSDYGAQLAATKGEVVVNGELSSLGTVVIDTDDGNITIEKDAKVESNGGSLGLAYDEWLYGLEAMPSVMILGAMDAAGTSNVKIEGTVRASDANGQAVVKTGFDGNTAQYSGGKGNIEVSGTLRGEGFVDLTALDGAIGISGSVGSGGDLKITSALGESSEGSTVIGKTGIVSAGGSLDVYSGFDSTIYQEPAYVELLTGVGGGILVEGKLSANEAISLNAVKGVVGLVDAEVQAPAVVMNGGLGAVKFAGRVVADAARLDATQYKAYGYAGNVELLNEANQVAEFSGSGKDVTFQGGADVSVGDVRAFGDARFYMSDGNITVKEGATVAVGGVLRMGTGMDKDGNNVGDITVNGTVVASDEVIFSANGNVEVGGHGKVSTTQPGSKVYLLAKERKDRLGNVVVKGEGRVESDKLYVSANASVTVERSATLKSTGAEGLVSVFAANGSGCKGDVLVDGDVSATGDSGNVWLVTEGDGGVRVGQDANVTAKGRATLWARSSGDVSVADNATVVAGRDASLYALNGDVSVSKGARVSADKVYVAAVYDEGAAGGRGSVLVDGSVTAKDLAIVKSGNGGVSIGKSGSVVATAVDGIAYVVAQGSRSDVLVAGGISADASRGNAIVRSANNAGSAGNVTIAGTGHVTSGASTQIIAGSTASTRGNVVVDGHVSSGGETDVATHSGGIDINGDVSGDGGVKIVTGINGGQSGTISFGSGGSATSRSYVDLFTTHGDLEQTGGREVVSHDGQTDSVSMSPVVSAPEINLNIRGNVGGGHDGYLAGEGTFFGLVSGNAAIAAADGSSFAGGSAPDHSPAFNMTAVELQTSVDATDIGTSTRVSSIVASSIDWGSAGDNSSIIADGDLSIYTSGELNPYGLLVAGRDLTVSAASFGDVSYLRAGGTLTINNVGKPAHPKIAYFESVNGVEPKINNQPNDTVIFVDGRLAGGNLKILNQFGADEAFLVETPELKSTQGIFGNPPFLHSDLDVANPLEVGAIDYMLQETPRLTLDKDFPKEADQHVDSVVIPERDSIQFGRGATAKNEATTEDDKVASE